MKKMDKRKRVRWIAALVVLLLLLVLGNVVFVLYDVLIPRIAYLLNKRLSAFLR